MLAALAVLLLAQESSPSDVRGRTPAVAPGLEELEGLAREFAELLCARRPWLAVERGYRPDSPLGLGPWKGRDASAWRRRLEDLERRLALFSGERGAEVRAERDALAAAVELEGFLSDPWQAERWNALEWVERADRTLRMQLESGTGRESSAEIAAILGALPDAWEEARKALVLCPDPWRTDAIARLAELEALLATIDLGGSPADETTRSRALEACMRFRDALAEIPHEETRPARPLGESRWLQMVDAAAGFHGTAQELESLLLRDVAALERNQRGLDSLARPPEALAASTASEPSVEDLALEASRAAWKARFAAVLGEVEPPSFVVRSGDLPARLGQSSLFLPRTRDGAKLLVDPAFLVRSDARAWRRATLRAGIPGEGLLCWNPLRGAGSAARYLWNRALVEGWGWLALDDLRRGEDALLAAETAGELELESLRLLASLELHAQGLSLERTAERFARRSGFSEERSLLEARRSLDDPLRGIGVLGYRELARLRDAAADERAFLELVLAHPHFRPADLAGTPGDDPGE